LNSNGTSSSEWSNNLGPGKPGPFFYARKEQMRHQIGHQSACYSKFIAKITSWKYRVTKREWSFYRTRQNDRRPLGSFKFHAWNCDL